MARKIKDTSIYAAIKQTRVRVHAPTRAIESKRGKRLAKAHKLAERGDN